MHYRLNLTDVSKIQLASAVSRPVYTLFICSEIGGIPNNKPKTLKDEITNKITSHTKIDSLKFTRQRKIVIETKSEECAIEVLQLKQLLNVNVKVNLLRESVTSRFLLRNIPVNITLKELYEELCEENDIKILELCRFTRKVVNEVIPTQSVLVTVLGITLPKSVRLFYQTQNITLFYDRPRQCSNCFKFNHSFKM